GNEGVTGTVKNTPNSIGYVELIYAESNKIPYGTVKNASGVFVKPSLAAVSAAEAGAAKSMPDDFRVSITNALGQHSYPISCFPFFFPPLSCSSPCSSFSIYAEDLPCPATNLALRFSVLPYGTRSSISSEPSLLSMALSSLRSPHF